MRIVSLSALGAVLLAGVAGADTVNSVVLRVNDEIATLEDYTARKEARLEAISAADDLAPEERRRLASEAGRATMREILDEMLLVARARQLSIQPTGQEIDEAIERTRQRMGIPTEEAFRRALDAAGMTLADYRERTARSIKTQQVIQREVHPRAAVDDEWAWRYYRDHPAEFLVPAKVKVQEIVVSNEELSGESARELAETVRAAIAGGETMQAAIDRLASKALSGPIDLGWVERGELASALDGAVWGLAVGAVSSPVEARGGLHLLQVVERTEESARPFEEVKEPLLEHERETRFDDELRKYLGELERSAYLVENIPVEAAGFRDVAAPEEKDPLAAFAPHRAPKPAEPPPLEARPEEVAPPPPAP